MSAHHDCIGLVEFFVFLVDVGQVLKIENFAYSLDGTRDVRVRVGGSSESDEAHVANVRFEVECAKLGGHLFVEGGPHSDFHF